MTKEPKTCPICGNEFVGRSDKKYCSDACKQDAYNKRKQEEKKLLQSKKMIDSNLSTVTKTLTPSFIGKMVDTAGEGVGNIVKQPLNDFSRQIGLNGLQNAPSTVEESLKYRRRAAAQIASVAIGAGVGFLYAKESEKKEIIPYVGMGGFAGMMAFQFLDLFKNPFGIYPGGNLNEVENVQPALDYTVEEPEPELLYSGNEVKYMQLNGITIDGELGDWLGNRINHEFWMMIHGGPGSGKSHLGTYLAEYFSNRYSVLYILAEEGITESVKKRIARYDLEDNVMMYDTKKHQDILNRIKNGNYNIVVLDSLQALDLGENYMVDFVNSIRKTPAVTGVITVNQNTKNNEARGSLNILHECDIVVTVDETIATTTKNRFNQAGVSFPIFADSMQTH